MIFWNVSIVTGLIIALIELVDYYDDQSIESYPTESFSQEEILEKQLIFEFSKLSRKVVRADWWNCTFLNGKYLERKVTKQ